MSESERNEVQSNINERYTTKRQLKLVRRLSFIIYIRKQIFQPLCLHILFCTFSDKKKLSYEIYSIVLQICDFIVFSLLSNVIDVCLIVRSEIESKKWRVNVQ